MAQTLDTLGLDINLNVSGLGEIQQVQRRMQGMDRQIRSTTGAINQYAAAHNSAGRDVQKFSMGVLQQAGYQLGDFYVQVANGTSAVQAIGQQGAQMLGIFGPIGAVLGAGVAIWSAYAVAAERAASAAKNVTEQGKQLLEAYQSIEQLDFSNLAAGATDALKEFQPIIDFMREERMRNLQKQLENFRTGISTSAAQVSDEARRNLETLQYILQQMRSDNVVAYSKEDFADINREIVKQSELMSDTVHIANILNGIQGNTRQELVRSIQAAYEQLVAFNLINDETKTTLTNLLESVDATAVLGDEAKRAEEAVRDAEKASSDMADELERAANAVMNINTNAFQKLSELQAELRGRSRGLTDEQIRIQQAARQAELAAREAGVDSAAELAAIAAEAAKVERGIIEAENAITQYTATATSGTQRVRQEIAALNDIQLQQRDIARAMESSFERGFMAMVDGTMSVQDAFRAMAADIIRELYRVLVVQRLVGGFDVSKQTGTGIVGAIMGAFGGARAMGGPISAGRAYMVGERGPEMIVPSRNATVVPNNQLGGAQQIVVNYTFQGGVTEADLARALPVLVQRTKREIVDAVQRGGSMSRAFG